MDLSFVVFRPEVLCTERLTFSILLLCLSFFFSSLLFIVLSLLFFLIYVCSLLPICHLFVIVEEIKVVDKCCSFELQIFSLKSFFYLTKFNRLSLVIEMIIIKFILIKVGDNGESVLKNLVSLTIFCGCS